MIADEKWKHNQKEKNYNNAHVIMVVQYVKFKFYFTGRSISADVFTLYVNLY